MKKLYLFVVIISFVLYCCNEMPENPITVDDIIFKPLISFVSPQNGDLFSTDDTVQFKARVNDADNEYSEISVKWESDKDGVLFTGGLDNEGYTEFETSSLSYNVHNIILKASDSNGHSSIDSMTINANLPEEVLLFDLEKDYSSINLRWTKYISSDFNHYEIRRYKDFYGYNSQTIATVSEANDTTYQDSSVVPGETYFYEIYIYNQDNISNVSNLQSAVAGYWIDMTQNVSRIIGDLQRNKLYAISGSYSGDIYFIDLASNQIENSIYITNNLFDLEIDSQGDTLYIGNSSYYRIYKVDLNSQQYVNFINTNDRTSSISCTNQGRLIFGDYYYSSPLYLINTSSGLVLDQTNVYYYDIDLAYSNSGNIIFAGERNGYNSKLVKYNTIGDSLTLVNESNYLNVNDGNVLLSSDDNFIYYAKRKWNANDLSQNYGEFSEDIYNLSPDGRVAISENNMYDTSTFDIIRPLPVSTTVSTFLNDKLYIYDSNSYKIFILTY